MNMTDMSHDSIRTYVQRPFAGSDPHNPCVVQFYTLNNTEFFMVWKSSADTVHRRSLTVENKTTNFGGFHWLKNYYKKTVVHDVCTVYVSEKHCSYALNDDCVEKMNCNILTSWQKLIDVKVSQCVKNSNYPRLPQFSRWSSGLSVR